ncbi:nucleoid-associated protein [Methylovulum psychrotolerans]|uniref:Nucleoid-associated protein n=1 Tax=Methylovulum psychrotolerans TaxID=1704499 RepID=A0A1Z4BZT5_9GAMM|nr:nucleoid-associated protein [Methylovulum psychrotolerans]ASF46782.1 hypothetical protein CEK71_12235 [Methylovulum psychrotolerans]
MLTELERKRKRSQHARPSRNGVKSFAQASGAQRTEGELCIAAGAGRRRAAEGNNRQENFSPLKSDGSHFSFREKSWRACDIAKKLTDAQQRKSIPGGIIVIFYGKQGHPLKKFLGIIKAEIHSAYEKELNKKTNEISLKYIEEALLTPGTRLYKTAGFFEKASYDETSTDLNKKWTVMVSDYQISQAEGKAAAQYFYADFLGCGYLQTSARTTKKFYESASSFIAKLDIAATDKNDLFNALTIYLKVDTSSTISSSDFASKYFDVDTQDVFAEYMEESGLPTAAFTKDTIYIDKHLKFRKISFSKNVNITAPSEIFRNLVSIEYMEGDPDESGTPAEWTRVIIKDRITRQE